MWSGQFRGERTANIATWVFTKRGGGVSVGAYQSLNLATHVGDTPKAVRANRHRLAERLGVPDHRLAIMRAAHGAEVHYVTQKVDTDVAPGDGLVTSSPGVGLAALVADCVPIVLADVDGGVIATAHCGWPGVVADVVGATVSAMIEAGADVEKIDALAGPAICGRCYAVSVERQGAVAAVVPEAAVEAESSGPAIDIRRGVLIQLERAGITGQAIGGCTAEDPELFSYRRDGVTGRQAGGIVWQAGAVSGEQSCRSARSERC